MSRENALSQFIQYQLHPLGERGELSRHLRIFNWEAVRPTAVYRKLMSKEAAPFMVLAVDLVRRFLPEADQSTLMMAAVWLVGQCSIFVRSREQLANPSVSLAMDAATIERLTRLVSTWALAGLARRHNCTSEETGIVRPPSSSKLFNQDIGFNADELPGKSSQPRYYPRRSFEGKSRKRGGDIHAWGYEAGETTIGLE